MREVVDCSEELGSEFGVEGKSKGSFGKGQKTTIRSAVKGRMELMERCD